ncbi:MAG: phytanoyl-CoA dioxygenase family protein [Pseudomonadales bacterium]
MQLHPRNLDFRWRAAGGPYRILTPEQAGQYDEFGYVRVAGAFSGEEVREVTAAIDPLEARFTRMLKERFDGRHFIARADAITFTIHLVTQSPVLKRFSQHVVFQRLCHDTLGPPARLYWDQAVYKKPGNPEEFPWHQDNGYSYVEPQQYLTCWVALTDTDVDNGCPWVVPGVHRLGTLVHRRMALGLQCLSEPEGAVPVPAKAGDIVVFSSLTPHRTGPNLTDRVRKSYILQYAPDGAAVYREGRDEPELQNDPERQFLVVAG